MPCSLLLSGTDLLDVLDMIFVTINDTAEFLSIQTINSKSVGRLLCRAFLMCCCQSFRFQKRRPAETKHSHPFPSVLHQLHHCHHNSIIMPPTEDKRKAARETIDILYEISSLLVCDHTSSSNAHALDVRLFAVRCQPHDLYCFPNQ